MNTNPPDTEQFVKNDEENAMPTARKNGWLLLYGAFAVLGIVGLIIIAIYRQTPKRSAPVEKRKVPAVRTVFTSILSPVDSVMARAILQEVTNDIGADSASVQMNISGTAIYKRCSSFADFQKLFFEAMTTAEPENLKRQAVLLSHVAGVITSDALPTKLYIIGRIANEPFALEEKRLLGFAQVLGMRNESMSKVQIVAFIPHNPSPQADSVRSLFVSTLRRGKYEFIER